MILGRSLPCSSWFGDVRACAVARSAPPNRMSAGLRFRAVAFGEPLASADEAIGVNTVTPPRTSAQAVARSAHFFRDIPLELPLVPVSGPAIGTAEPGSFVCASPRDRGGAT